MERERSSVLLGTVAEGAAPGAARAGNDAHDRLELQYIADMIAELGRLADRRGARVLAGILALAEVEAARAARAAVE